MIKVNDTVRIKNDRDYSHLRLWKVISVNDDTVVAELISYEVKEFRRFPIFEACVLNLL